MKVSLSPGRAPCQILYGLYIVDGCDESVGCPPEVVGQIACSLWPAYEDLFDVVEEHTLSVLLEQWEELAASDELRFQKVRIRIYMHACISLSQYTIHTVYKISMYILYIKVSHRPPIPFFCLLLPSLGCSWTWWLHLGWAWLAPPSGLLGPDMK